MKKINFVKLLALSVLVSFSSIEGSFASGSSNSIRSRHAAGPLKATSAVSARHDVGPLIAKPFRAVSARHSVGATSHSEVTPSTTRFTLAIVEP
jgi:hypothetical protein